MRPVLSRVNKCFTSQLQVYRSTVPDFLCPILFQAPFRRRSCPTSKRFSTSRRWGTSIEQIDHIERNHDGVVVQSKKTLPISCPGCGALCQAVFPNAAGFYTENRPAVKAYLHGQKEEKIKDENQIFEAAISQANKDLKQDLGLQDNFLQSPQPQGPPIPICDRCHNLLHHSSGTSVIHPSLESIEQTISESPYKHNHIYHILDAADFPMSLIPNLQHRLSLTPMRTHNRRSKHRKWHHGRIAEVSFVITRADLLAPQKEQVDSLMPYLVEVLRNAMGRSAQKLRLGNVRCVSAKRGWWTKHVKEAIWEREGAGWMVGKVNVGKSNLFEAVFPKGKSTKDDLGQLHLKARSEGSLGAEQVAGFIEPSLNAASHETSVGAERDTEDLLEEDVGGELLPPAQAETPYPVMPITSALPGTTASPIRVPFGKGKGELIDLPGLERSSLDKYVRPEHRNELIMAHRIVPEQQTIKTGQSLLLGGLIRITPMTPDLVFLSYAFLPLSPHVTSTEKAVGIQTGERVSGVPTIGEDFAGKSISSAGVFQLKWDVTKRRAGPLTSPSAAKLKPEQLPFTVYAADILVEGCGWVEVVAQVRKRRPPMAEPAPDNGQEAGIYRPVQECESMKGGDLLFPTIEVFSPEGKFIGVRPPMNGWLLNKRPDPAHARKSRPRRSMRSMKAARKSKL